MDENIKKLISDASDIVSALSDKLEELRDEYHAMWIDAAYGGDEEQEYSEIKDSLEEMIDVVFSIEECFDHGTPEEIIEHIKKFS